MNQFFKMQLLTHVLRGILLDLEVFSMQEYCLYTRRA